MDLASTPPITRAWALSALALAVAEHVHLVSQYQLWFSPNLVLGPRREWWRVFTSFAYFGPLGVDFLFHLFFFVRYSRMLEENHFGPAPRRRTRRTRRRTTTTTGRGTATPTTDADGQPGAASRPRRRATTTTTTVTALTTRKADYVVLLAFSSLLLLLLSPLAALPFLGSPLAFVLVYVWSRRNAHVRLSLFGVLVVTAPYLPWSLVALSWLISGSARAVAGDLMGVAVGHAYYFLVDVWPRELKSGGRNLLATPAFLTRLLDDDGSFDDDDGDGDDDGAD